MPKYEVVESLQWRHKLGATVSFHGAVPWTRPAEKEDWTVESCGWTVYNPITNTYGVCRPPWTSRESAQRYADTHRPLTLSFGD